MFRIGFKFEALQVIAGLIFILPMKQLHYSIFRIAAFITAALGIVLVLVSAFMGRNEFFLLLNNDLGVLGDWFFRYWTNTGDGAIWVVLAIPLILYRRKLLLLFISTIVISTLLTQVTKNYIYPAEPRPTAAISDHAQIHTVPGVEVHTAYSFPSGHTATAFSIFLLACLIMPQRWVLPVGLIYALLAGYSRIYLAQHFPLDVGAGMLAALISVLLSIKITQRFSREP